MKKLNSNHKTIATAQPTGRGIKRLTMAVLLLLVSHWVTAQTTFTNSSSISCGSAFGGATNGSPYPSNITVSGMTGCDFKCNCFTPDKRFAHTNPDDIDIVSTVAYRRKCNIDVRCRWFRRYYGNRTYTLQVWLLQTF
jgi:hypothetical protein